MQDTLGTDALQRSTAQTLPRMHVGERGDLVINSNCAATSSTECLHSPKARQVAVPSSVLQVTPAATSSRRMHPSWHPTAAMGWADGAIRIVSAGVAVANSATREAALGSHSFAVQSFEALRKAPLSSGNQSTAVAAAVCPPEVLGAMFTTGACKCGACCIMA